MEGWSQWPGSSSLFLKERVMARERKSCVSLCILLDQVLVGEVVEQEEEERRLGKREAPPSSIIPPSAPPGAAAVGGWAGTWLYPSVLISAATV